MMYQRDVKVMAIKAHASHLTQPLDKNPFAAFKEEFNTSLRKFNRRVGGRSIKKEEYFSVFNIAWARAMTSKNIMAGFKCTGIWPPNRQAIKEEQMAPGAISKGLECCWLKYLT